MRQSTLQDISFSHAKQKGEAAAAKGISYDANPYDATTQPTLRRYWSDGHNSMQARIAVDEQERLEADPRYGAF